MKNRKLYIYNCLKKTISTIVICAFALTSIGVSPAYTQTLSGRNISPQSIFSPLKNREIKEIAMLEYFLVSGILSGRINVFDQSEDIISDELDEEIAFLFTDAVVDRNAGIGMIPCTYRGVNYWCLARRKQDPVSREELPYDLIFYTAEQLKDGNPTAAMLMSSNLERHEQLAIRMAVDSEKKHDEKIRNAIKADKYLPVYSYGSFDLSFALIYSFLDTVAPSLALELREMVDKGQLMVITGTDQDTQLTEPHAGGMGIYIPNDERFLKPEVIIHEVFAKAGYLHEEDVVFEELFKRYIEYVSDSNIDSPLKLPEKMPLSAEEKRLLNEARYARFIDLTEVIKRRDYSDITIRADDYDPLFYSRALVPMIQINLKDGSLKLANDLAVELFGYGSMVELMKDFRITKHWADKSGKDAFYEKLLKKGSLKNFSIRMFHADGTPFWVELFATVYPREGYMDVVAIDITSRKEMEEKVTVSEEKFRSFFDHMPDGILVFDGVKGGVFLGGNHKISKMLGHTPDEIKELKLMDVFQKEDIDAEFGDLFTGQKKGVKRILVKRKDGSTFYADITADIVKMQDSEGKDNSGKTLAREYFMFTFHDVTQQKEAEKRYQELIRTANSIILEMDLEGNIIDANKFAQEFFGYHKDELIGRSVLETIVPREEGATGRDMTKMIEGIIAHPEKSSNNDNENIRKNRERVWVSWTNSPILDSEGNIEGILCVGNETTHLKNAALKATEGAERYRALFDNMVEGAALHEIILDDNGIPVDYRFIEINYAFFKHTALKEKRGMKKSDIEGHTIKEIMPGIEKDSVDWIGIYGEVALTGKSNRFTHFSQSLGKWYTVSAYCPKKGQFVTIFEDVSEHKLSNEKLRILLQEYPDAVLYKEFEGNDLRIKYANAGAYEFMGLDPATQRIEGLTDFEIKDKYDLGDDYKAEWYAYDDYRVFSGERTLYSDHEVIIKGGRVRHVEVNKQRLGNGVLCTFSDITARKEMEEKLRAGESKYRELFEASPTGIHTVTPEGIIKEVNTAETEILGYTRTEMIGSSIFDFIVPEQREDAKRRFEAKLEGRHIRKKVDRQYLTKDGGTIIGETKDTVIKDENGKPVEVITTLQDVTEHRKAEMSLERSEEKLREIYDKSPIGIVLYNKDGAAVEANPSSLNILGLEDLSLMEADLFQYIHQIAGNGVDGLKEGQPLSFEATIDFDELRKESAEGITRSGYAFVDFRVTPLGAASGTPAGYLVQIEDITERKNSEIQLRGAYAELAEKTTRLIEAERLSAIGENTTALVDKINNPANNIMNLIDGILSRLHQGGIVEKTDIADALQEVNKEIARISDITDRFLGFARAQTIKGPCSVEAVLRDVVEMRKETIESLGIEVEIETNEDFSVVIADKGRLKQAFLNLVMNAVSSMKNSDTRKLRLSTERATDENGKKVVRVNFTDTGCGIAENDMEDIWKPFQVKREGEMSSGLGLVVVKEVVESLSGEIKAESVLGEGSTFTLELPVVTPYTDTLQHFIDDALDNIYGSLWHDVNNILMVKGMAEIILTQGENIPDHLAKKCKSIFEKSNEVTAMVAEGRHAGTAGEKEAVFPKIRSAVKMIHMMAEEVYEERARFGAKDDIQMVEYMHEAMQAGLIKIEGIAGILKMGRSFKNRSKLQDPIGTMSGILETFSTSKRFFKDNAITFEKIETFYRASDESLLVNVDDAAFTFAIYNALQLGMKNDGTPGERLDPEKKKLKVFVEKNGRSGEVRITFRNNYFKFKGEDIADIDIGLGEEGARILKWGKQKSTPLAAARKTLACFAGRLTVANEKEGSVVRVFLPYTLAKDKAAVEPVVAEPEEKVEQKKDKPDLDPVLKAQSTIIFADDEPLTRKFMKDFLGGSGYNVHLAANGQEAFDMIQKMKSEGISVDLAIFDVSMPPPSGSKILDGLVLTEEVRNMGHEFPILIFTGHAADDPRFIKLEEENVISGLIPKPFHMDIALAKIEEALAEGAPKAEKALDLQIVSAEKVALIYGEDTEKGIKKLKSIGFKGEFRTAKDSAELKKHLTSGEEFVIIVNTTNEDLEELIKKILANLDTCPPVVNVLDDEHTLQTTLLEICA